jgi:transaldolase
VSALKSLGSTGVSVWLDDLGRDRIDSGGLAALIDDGVRGVTTNPSIFAAAVASSSSYRDRLAALGAVPAEEALHRLMVDDVRDACDAFTSVHDASDGLDGRVSLEVDPRLAFNTDATIAAARQVWADVDRPNLMVKIPATREGLPAVTAALAAGISVNVTLIFSVQRYREVQLAWLQGLEQALDAGRDVGHLASVASFFVSRLDTAVDGRLDALADAGRLAPQEHQRLRGRAAVANARIAYRQFVTLTEGERWSPLQGRAIPQRPLWASTSTKDPAFSPTRYVDELVAPGTVNTMPLSTLNAVLADPRPRPSAIEADAESQALDDAHFAALRAVGIEYDEVVADLERAGVAAFITSWEQLLGQVAALQSAS